MVRITQLEKSSSFILDFNCRSYRTKLNSTHNILLNTSFIPMLWPC